MHSCNKLGEEIIDCKFYTFLYSIQCIFAVFPFHIYAHKLHSYLKTIYLTDCKYKALNLASWLINLLKIVL